jgi:hypothetical protein
MDFIRPLLQSCGLILEEYDKIMEKLDVTHHIEEWRFSPHDFKNQRNHDKLSVRYLFYTSLANPDKKMVFRLVGDFDVFKFCCAAASFASACAYKLQMSRARDIFGFSEPGTFCQVEGKIPMADVGEEQEQSVASSICPGLGRVHTRQGQAGRGELGY